MGGKGRVVSAAVFRVEHQGDVQNLGFQFPVSYTHLDVYKRQEKFHGPSFLIATPDILC